MDDETLAAAIMQQSVFELNFHVHPDTTVQAVGGQVATMPSAPHVYVADLIRTAE